MDDESESVRQLKQIKIWIAIGGVGFFLVGAAALIFAISIASFTAMAEEAIGEEEGCGEDADFEDRAEDLYERGRLDELAALIGEREKTHPNDANVHWYRARLHATNAQWDDALSELHQVRLLAPSWEAKYVEPLEGEILRRRGAAP